MPTQTKNEILELLKAEDPFNNFQKKEGIELWGWNGDSPIFSYIINQVKPEDHSMIIYTSGGATGIVKGVEFTHKNILGHQKALEQVLNIEHSDRVLSYYPWHHTMGITEQFLALYAGACLIIDRRPGIHPNTLADDLKTYKPTVYFGSGKVFNDIVFQMENNQKIKENNKKES